MRPLLCIAVLSLAAAGSVSAQLPVRFESKPRVIMNGRDPMLAVRASGAISLAGVDKGDLWLHTSFDGGDSFDAGVRVNDVPGEVESQAERSPQLSLQSGMEIYCLWQAHRADGSTALRFARSKDWGKSFSRAIDIDRTSGAGSQSFFTIGVSAKGTIYVAWLDGRDHDHCRQGSSAVYISRSVDGGASFEPPVRVALDACACCRPSITFTANDTVHVVWRRMLDGNVRDIFVATSLNAGVTWNSGVRVAQDDWSINGCPHSGAAASALGNRLIVSWYTASRKQPKLYIAFSDDAGKTFSKPLDLSGEIVDPNHPYMLNTGEQLSIVFQGRDPVDNDGWAPLDVYYRELDAQGNLSPLVRIGHARSSAAYPAIAFEEPGRLYLAWTEHFEEGQSIVMARGRRTFGLPAAPVVSLRKEGSHAD